MKNCDVNSPLNKKYSKKTITNYLCLYSIVFIVLSLFVFIWFLLGDKTSLYTGDGFYQHYTSLRYFGVYCRRIIKNLLATGALVIPQYDFTIGYGSDVLTTLHYYVIGDPLDLLTIFVPVKYTQYLYSALIVFRFYLAGLAFSLFTKKVFNTQKFPTFISSFVYIFCLYGLVAGTRHAYFMNPMIYFPLVLLGIEYIFAGKRPYLFIFMIFISAISNFYFFYMIVILMIIYAAFRFFTIYKENIFKNLISNIVRFGIYSLIGVGLAGVVFIPVVMAMFGTNRSQSSISVDLLYDLKYYRDYLLSFVSAGLGIGYYTYLGFSPLALFSIVVMHIRHKENKKFVLGFWLLTIMLLVPVFGYILNGFSYVTNRWVWAYSLLVSVITAINLPYLFKLKINEWNTFFKVLSGYYALCLLSFLFNASRTGSAGVGLGVLAFSTVLVTIIAMNDKNRSDGFTKSQKNSIISILLVGILLTSFAEYSPFISNTTSKFMSSEVLNNGVNETASAKVSKINDDSYYRYDIYDYSESNSNWNASMLSGAHANGGYFSLNSSSISDLYTDILEEQTLEQTSIGYHGRSMPLYLSSTKYYVVKKEKISHLPYGFDKFIKNIKTNQTENGIETEKIYKVYQNENALPLGYTFDSYISYSDYEKLTSTEKQQAMLQGVVVGDEYVQNVSKQIKNNDQLHFTDKIHHYEMSANNSNISKVQNDSKTNNSYNVIVNDNSIQTFSDNSKVVLTFDSIKNAEVYVRLMNLQYTPTSKNDMKKAQGVWENLTASDKITYTVQGAFWKGDVSSTVMFSSDKTKKSIQLNTDDYQWYSNRHDYDVCIKYSKLGTTEVTINFEKAGIYTFDSIDVVSVGMENVDSDVSKLCEDVLENIEYGNDKVTGTIDLEKSKLLCLSLPYSDGWSAYVDGEKVDIIKSNVAYMGIMVGAGHHDIKFTYETPYSHFGYLATAVGIVSSVGVIVIEETKMKRKKREEKSV